MERIQAAIQKAKEQRGETGAVPSRPLPVGGARPAGRPAATVYGPAWAELDTFEPDPGRMERNRIVTFADADPSHVSFDMMRTRLVRTLRQNGWTSVGVTSPTAGCGKTTVALNLAFSLAHQPDVRALLIDLDLRRPAVARDLDLPGKRSMARVLQGAATIEETFVRYGDNLAVGGNSEPARHSGDLLMSAATTHAIAGVKAAFAPDLILYDLPPMLMSDDTMAFLPHLDAVLLIAGAEKSRLDEVDKCEHDLAENTNLLGVVLNMCRYMGEDYGYY
jgi:Mrp family chromosome partitioning ATPase